MKDTCREILGCLLLALLLFHTFRSLIQLSYDTYKCALYRALCPCHSCILFNYSSSPSFPLSLSLSPLAFLWQNRLLI